MRRPQRLAWVVLLLASVELNAGQQTAARLQHKVEPVPLAASGRSAVGKPVTPETVVVLPRSFERSHANGQGFCAEPEQNGIHWRWA